MNRSPLLTAGDALLREAGSLAAVLAFAAIARQIAHLFLNRQRS